MTTLAKIEANQRNGQLSTGPRTAEGKAAVARNATRHGIFSSVPVIPGEDPGVWEAHRAGVVESLAPVGLLEVNLAERAALLLWRLQRLARYEAETVAAAVEAAEAPPLPADQLSSLLPRGEKAREGQLRDLRERLRTARAELAAMSAARDLLARGVEAADGGAVPFAVASAVFEAALGRAEAVGGPGGDPPHFDTKVFLKTLDLAGPRAAAVAWTPALVRRGLAIYAGCAREPAEHFAEAVRSDLGVWAGESAREVAGLERDAAAVARLVEAGPARRRAARLLPADGREERVAKYERHLHSLLTSTLHELERLQARREGEAVPPPAVADVNVTVDAGPG